MPNKVASSTNSKKIHRKRMVHVNFAVTVPSLGKGFQNTKIIRVSKAKNKNALLVTLQTQKIVQL